MGTTRPALLGLLLAFALAGPVAGQSPYDMPKPLGGPIVGLDGKIMTGLDRQVSPWSGSIEFGLNGNQGNVDILKIRSGLGVKYDDPSDYFDFNAVYVLTKYQENSIEQKALASVRNEVYFSNSLAWYAQGALEYDEFLTVDFLLGAHNGLSLTAYNANNTRLKLRGGFGTAWQYGGSIDEWVPELQFGTDFDYALTARTKISLSADYYPEIRNFARYRVRGRAALEVLLDQELNLLIRVGVLDRYNEPRFGKKANDLDYFLTIVFGF